MRANELIKRLKKMGATIERPRGGGSHHRVILPNGRITIVAMHPAKEIPTRTFHKMLRELGLSKRDLMG